MIDPVDVKRSYRDRAGLHVRAQPLGRQRRAAPGVRRQARRELDRRLTADASTAEAPVLGLGRRGRGADARAAGEDGRRRSRARFGVDAARRRSTRRRSTRSTCARRASRRPTSLAHLCTDRSRGTRRPHLRQVVPRRLARRCTATSRNPPDLVAIPRDEDDIVALLDWCSDAGVAAIPYGGGSSVVGGVECDIDDDYRGAVSIDLRALDQVLEVDRDVARGAHPGRRLRPRARGPAAPARPDAAPLPAVVRVLDARRLARDPLRRPLRDAAHAHRRLRRVDPRGHAARRVGEPAPARLGRGTVARPHAARLRRHRSA